MLTLLVLAVILPIIGAVVSVFLKPRGAGWVSALFALGTAVVGVVAAVRIFPGNYTSLFGGFPWLKDMAQPSIFGLAIDPLSGLMLGLVTVMGLAIAIYSGEYLSGRNKEHSEEDGHRSYYFWLLVFIGAMAGLVLSPNLLQMFIFWEITTLCSWVLISHNQTKNAINAGYKALIMTHAGGLFFLGGLLVLFASTKSFEFTALGLLSPSLKTFVFVLFLIAAWSKAAQIPFHTWLPSAMEAPTPISAYLHAAAMVKAGVYLIARLGVENWALNPVVGMIVGIGAIATMLMAMLFYFLQDDLKRLLAYSTIAHLAYVLLGLGIGFMGSELAFRGGVLHILGHGVAKTTLFLTVGAIAYGTGTRKISELGGLARRLPIETFAFFTAAFTVTGVPPFACFWSKFYIFQGAMETQGPVGPVLMILALTESVVSFAWFLWVGYRVFYAVKLTPEGLEPASEMAAPEPVLVDPPAIHWTILVLAIASVLVPLVGIPLVQQIPMP